MEYYAHTKENGEKQLLNAHLNNTAALSSSFSIYRFKNCATLCGLMHDIGKYQKSFQQKLDGKNINIEHSGCGAKEIEILIRNKFVSVLFGYIIAGHHSGLPDYGSEQSDSNNADLCARLKRDFEDYSCYKNYINFDVKSTLAELASYFNSNDTLSCDYEFLIRYLFSCLVDADYLDTEEFCAGRREGIAFSDWQKYVNALHNKLSNFTAQTKLQKSRAILQKQAYVNIKSNANIYLLDMPTGSGKTICSLNLALERLIVGGKKRIIYVVPYTSIIEQTSKVFNNLFDKQSFNDFTILEHHSNFDFEQQDAYDDGTGKNKLKMASENWDAPFIITTNVQFFESIYSNRSSRLRKFHNMADSILVFDEIHTLPMEYFVSCMKAVEQLTKNYNSQAIFLSATMPDFISLTEKYVGHKIDMLDLVPDKREYDNFVKCKYSFIGDCDVTQHFKGDKSALMIFNTRKTTGEFYSSYTGGKKYYLSTYMTPKHRSQVLEKIREDLANNEKIAVFSTSLIEAGVDVDFDCVYREITGLDSILQAGGRCNREGKRAAEESDVFIFTHTANKQNGEIAVKAEITKGLIEKYGAQNINTNECMKEYFDEIYRYTQQQNGQIKENIKNFYKIQFKQKAEDFKFIDSSAITVCVPDSDIYEELEKLKTVGFANRRLLQKYSASVMSKDLKELLEQGIVADINGVYVLQNMDYYSAHTGLCINKDIDYIF